MVWTEELAGGKLPGPRPDRGSGKILVILDNVRLLLDAHSLETYLFAKVPLSLILQFYGPEDTYFQKNNNITISYLNSRSIRKEKSY